MTSDNNTDNNTSSLDFLLSALIGAGTALVASHLFKQFDLPGNKNKMSLEKMTAEKEKLDDMIAEYMADLKS